MRCGSVQKVWDDKLLSNASFAFIYPFFTGEEMNRLEATFLNLLHFEVVVKPSTYAKYYFELRAVQDVSVALEYLRAVMLLESMGQLVTGGFIYIHASGYSSQLACRTYTLVPRALNSPSRLSPLILLTHWRRGRGVFSSLRTSGSPIRNR